jgi:hypothetical protein
MDKSMRNSMMTAAIVAGAASLGVAGMMGMQKMNEGRHVVLNHSLMGGHHGGMMHDMANKMSDMGDEFADEFCMMAHKTGNAMIRTGRLINKMVP